MKLDHSCGAVTLTPETLSDIILLNELAASIDKGTENEWAKPEDLYNTMGGTLTLYGDV